MTDPNAKHAYTGWLLLDEYEGPGSTIRWGSWSEMAPIAPERYVPITMFPYSSGSDYSGDTVELSNYQVLAEDEHVMSRSVLIQGSHGTFGIAYIGFPTRRIREIVAALESYPLLDESHHSELEMIIEQREWNEWGLKEFRHEVEKEFGEFEVTDNTLDDTWWSFCEQHSDGGRVFEQGDSVHFYVDDAVKWLRKEREIGNWLVLGRVEWSERHTLSVARDAALEGRNEECLRILKLFTDCVLVELETPNDE